MGKKGSKGINKREKQEAAAAASGPSSSTHRGSNDSNGSNKDGKNSGGNAVTNDLRFAFVERDPRFMKAKRDHHKVKLDKRFAGMLTNADFTNTATVDRYGRRIQDKRGEAQLRRLYKIDGEEESSSKKQGKKSKEKAVDDPRFAKASTFESNREDSGSESEPESDSESDSSVGSGYESSEAETDNLADSTRRLDLARGEGLDSSSEESDMEWSESSGGEEEIGDFRENPYNIPRGDETRRLACVNIDWEHIRATDLYVAFSAFKPDGGSIISVVIYPSQFGKERMAREVVEGPPREIFGEASGTDSEDEDGDDSEVDLVARQVEEGDGKDFSQVKLRKYELEKLKYYYAVVTCDSVATARAIYNQCDGAEYESSANFFDLRYIPDDMSFNEEEPRDMATQIPAKYKPTEFVTQALQHSNVKLTWDQDDPDRVQVTRRRFTKDEIDDMDFKTFIASESSSEDEDDEEARQKAREKYLTLFELDKGSSDGSDGEKEVEITFTPGLSETVAAKLSSKQDQAVPEGETTLEKYMRKQKEKRQRKKEARVLAKTRAEQDEDLVSDEELPAQHVNDPFFTLENSEDDGDAGTQPVSTTRPSDKKKKWKEKADGDSGGRETGEGSRETNDAELELLIDSADDGRRHFDLKEIMRAEKLKGKKIRRKGKGARKVDTEVVQDDFKLNFSDSRFSALYESHKFAIDPNNPQFKKTSAMQELLNERRKRQRIRWAEDA
ncbi:pre-rRNA-processing protein esf1 [Spiromyces aspiralis]|uniref:Pre-rRNA-processing protein esf1 n=1 Tax=Spiromyces aspiralis TaxID=68401 RepID=A0ACC1HHD3_9FUNG|nr:pre-rRNA-processing protein esf1 [Spiromyces aspiralis]